MTTTETLSLTGHELLYILGMIDSPSSKRSRELLEMFDVEEAADYELFGMVSLRARDLASIEGDKVLPVAAGMHVAVALLEAQEWVRLVFTNGPDTFAHVIVRSETAAIAMQAREFGIYDILPIPPDTDLKELCIDVVRASIEELEDKAICAVQFITLSGDEVAVNFEVSGDEARVVTAHKEANETDQPPVTVAKDEAIDTWADQVRNA